MSAAGEDIAQDRSWRFVEVCPHCGYSLAGSPDEGTCPECGQEYNQHVIVLHGAAMGQKAHLGNASPRRLWLIGGVLLFQVWFFWVNADNSARSSWLFWSLLSLWIASLVPLLVQRFANHRPGLIQVLLSSRGCAQTEEGVPDAVRMIGGTVIPVLVVGLLIFAAVRSGWKGMIAWIAVTIVAAIPLTRFVAREMRKISNPGKAPRAVDVIASLGHRWQGNEQFTFNPTRAGYFRLKIWIKASWYRLQDEFVDAEIVCEKERSDLIARQIIAWIRENRAENAEPAAAV